MGISENEVRKRAAADRLEINSVGDERLLDADPHAASHRL
jgi:hypothetical protein